MNYAMNKKQFIIQSNILIREVTNMIKVAIFQYDLSVGGIQKSLVNLLNNIDRNKYEIDVYLFNNNFFYVDQLPANTNVVILNKYAYINRIVPFNIVKKVAKCTIGKEYDIAIDFNSYLNECSINAIKVKAKKRFIWCHNDVEKKTKNEFLYRILFTMSKKKYSYFDKVIAVSEGARQAFFRKTGYDLSRIEVVPNTIDYSRIWELSEEHNDLVVDENKYNLCTVGRICHQKGFDILIRKMNDIVKRRQDIHLYMIGDGKDRKKIEKLIGKYKLENHITLLGNQKNPFSYVMKMDGFVLTSRYEGQGMVILEAQCLGLELFISKHLEKYVTDIKGCDIVDEICNAKKTNKKKFALDNYNKEITKKIDSLLSK